MEPNALYRRNVRTFYAYLGSLLMAAVAPIVAGRLIESHVLWVRITGVAVGVLGWIPLMLFTAYVIRVGDEYTRRMHLVALAWAFAFGLLLLSVVDMLVRADFIEPIPYMVVWLAMAIGWVVCLLATKRYYERAE